MLYFGNSMTSFSLGSLRLSRTLSKSSLSGSSSSSSSLPVPSCSSPTSFFGLGVEARYFSRASLMSSLFPATTMFSGTSGCTGREVAGSGCRWLLVSSRSADDNSNECTITECVGMTLRVRLRKGRRCSLGRNGKCAGRDVVVLRYLFL